MCAKPKTMMIDGMPVLIENEKNILEVIRKAGIDLPTFCYHSELSTYGACRMCVVENKCRSPKVYNGRWNARA